MTSQLQNVLHLTKSLSFSEQIELMKELSTIIQTTYTEKTQPSQEPEDDLGFSAESFRTSWEQARSGQTLPLSQLWDGIEDD